MDALRIIIVLVIATGIALAGVALVADQIEYVNSHPARRAGE